MKLAPVILKLFFCYQPQTFLQSFNPLDVQMLYLMALFWAILINLATLLRIFIFLTIKRAGTTSLKNADIDQK